MKLLIAVLSCKRDRSLHETIRSVWSQRARELGIEVRFFVQANDQAPERDETHLACDDGRAGLPYKVREICKWASAKQIDYLYICYANTLPDPKKVLHLANENNGVVDYMGRFNKPVGRTFRLDTIGKNDQPERYERCYPWAQGRLGYFLSRNAFESIAKAYPSSTIEDLWVGQELGALAAVGEIIPLDIPEQNAYSIPLNLNEILRVLQEWKAGQK